jgi:aryl-alcohol dehydrogenase-like predicted oxidoreductase
MHSLNDLVVSGNVLYLGISNTPSWVVSKANQYARDNNLRQLVVCQGLWNTSIRDLERDIVPMCRDEGMGLLPYGILNQGRFQTKLKLSLISARRITLAVREKRLPIMTGPYPRSLRRLRRQITRRSRAWRWHILCLKGRMCFQLSDAGR